MEDIAGDRAEIDTTANLEKLAGMLQSGKPTFAYFYYSVACSCTAVQCSLAAESIERTEELNSENEHINYISIDAFSEAVAESLDKLQVVPLIIGFNAEGKEVARADWDVDMDAVEMVLGKIEKKRRIDK